MVVPSLLDLLQLGIILHLLRATILLEIKTIAREYLGLWLSETTHQALLILELEGLIV